MLKFLKAAAPNQWASAKGFMALFRRYAQCGRQGLTTDQFHLASNPEEQIWEFRKGALRMYCFEDGEHGLVILTHGAVKKTQKTPRTDIAKAVTMKERYLVARKGGGVVYQENNDDETPGS